MMTMTIFFREVTAMSNVVSIIIASLGCITMTCWTIMSIYMLVDTIKKKK